MRAEDFAARYQAVAATKGKATEAARLHELFKADWAVTMEVYPEFATYLGVPGYDMKWTDLSAAAYKLGELKIKELRAYATKELGGNFDIRLFHDEVLKNGAVPLSVLETQIKAWVAAQKR